MTAYDELRLTRARRVLNLPGAVAAPDPDQDQDKDDDDDADD